MMQKFAFCIFKMRTSIYYSPPLRSAFRQVWHVVQDGWVDDFIS